MVPAPNRGKLSAGRWLTAKKHVVSKCCMAASVTGEQARVRRGSYVLFDERRSPSPFSSCVCARCAHDLLNHLVRPQQQRLGNGEAERLGGLEVDDELELRRPFDRNFARIGAPENFVDVNGGPPEQVRQASHEGATVHSSDLRLGGMLAFD